MKFDNLYKWLMRTIFTFLLITILTTLAISIARFLQYTGLADTLDTAYTFVVAVYAIIFSVLWGWFIYEGEKEGGSNG
jgi:uncharacterized membrane protein